MAHYQNESQLLRDKLEAKSQKLCDHLEVSNRLVAEAREHLKQTEKLLKEIDARK